MSFFARLKTIVAAKGDAALDRAEVPAEMFNHAYNQMNDTLTNLKRAIVEVMTARKQIEQQIDRLDHQNATIEGQAKQALTMGDETLAQQALAQRVPLLEQRKSLESQRQQMLNKQSDLEASSHRLAAKIAAFRIEKETLAATATAATAQVVAASSVAGITEEMGSVNAAMDRARMKISQQSARADALSEVAGHLDFDTGIPIDPVQVQLNQATANADVASDLERLKAQMGLATSKPTSLPSLAQPSPQIDGTIEHQQENSK